jgi:hypothetical protein
MSPPNEREALDKPLDHTNDVCEDSLHTTLNVVKESEQGQNAVEYGEYADGGNGEAPEENSLVNLAKDKKVWVGRTDDKTPIGNNMHGTSPDRPWEWMTRDEALALKGKMASYKRGETLTIKPVVGIGVQLRGASLVGVDFDHCLGEGGLTDSHIADFLLEADTYTEISVSGKGIHSLFKVTDGFFRPTKNKLSAHDGFSDVEVYSEGRYFAVTEEMLGEDKPIREVTSDAMNALLALVGHTGGTIGEPTVPTAKARKSGIKWEAIPMASKEEFENILMGHAALYRMDAFKPYVEARKTGVLESPEGFHDGLLKKSCGAAMKEVGNPASGTDYKDKLIAVYRAMKYAISTFRIPRASKTDGLNSPAEFDDMFEWAYGKSQPEWEAERLAFIAKGGVERTGVYGLPAPTITIGSSMKEEPKADYVRVEGVEAPQMATNIAGVEYLKKAEEPLPDPYSWDELMAVPVEPMSWPLPGILPHPKLVAISGRPESYKTFFSCWMAIRMACGKPCFDNIPELPLGTVSSDQTYKILFIEDENDVGMTQDRLRAMGGHSPSGRLWFYVDQGVKVKDQKWREKIINFCKKNGIKMVFMDPFSSVMGMEDENSNGEASLIMDIIRKSFVKEGISVVFLHHPSKGDEGGKNLRGAGDILGKVDIHISMEREECAEDEEKKIRVTFEKVRCADRRLLKPFRIVVRGDFKSKDFRFEYLGEAKKKSEQEKDEMRSKIMDSLTISTGRTKKDVAESLGCTMGTGTKFDKAWKELSDERRFHKCPDGGFILNKDGHRGLSPADGSADSSPVPQVDF